MELEKLRKEQERLRKKIKITPFKGKVTLIGGCDVGYHKKWGIGVFITMDRNFNLVEIKFFKGKTNFPYIPGFLSYRELKLLVGAYKKLQKKPDIIFVDGNGILHPRNMGIATHLGIILGKPTIGCAKNLLIGEYEMPELKRGNKAPVKVNSKIMGYAVVTRDNTKPIFVSPGNLIDFDGAIKYTLLFSKFKIPEPIRIAHIETKKFANF